MSDDRRRGVKCPKGEDSCVTYYGPDGNPLFRLTTKPSTGHFFLYEFTASGLVRLGKGRSPLELEEKYDVRKRMGVE